MTGYWTLIDPMSSFLLLKTAEAEDISRGREKDVNLFQKGHIVGPCQANEKEKIAESTNCISLGPLHY